MKKFWIVYGIKNDARFERYETYQEAEDEAKRKVANSPGCDYFILEAVAMAKQPVPAADIIKF